VWSMFQTHYLHTLFHPHLVTNTQEICMSDNKIHMLHALRRKSKLIELRATLTNLQLVCNPIKKNKLSIRWRKLHNW
jgi:hypothetical protein